jgi:hypothetical protein
VGNRVGDQFQLDMFGEALSLFATAARLDRLDADGRAAVNVAVAANRGAWERTRCGNPAPHPSSGVRS